LTPSRLLKYSREAVYFLYSVLLGLALAAVVPLYFVKLRLGKGESLHLAERLGIRLPLRTRKGPFLWIHAVSVGEVLSLQSLVHELRAGHPDWEIGFSSLTNTGFRMAIARIKDADHLFYVPFDLGGSVRRTFRRLRPDLLVLAESEFWPRMLKEARRRGCPVLSVNGRVSPRTFRRFLHFRWFARPLLDKVDRFLVQTDADSSRLEAVGVPFLRIQVAGNLKCEIRLPELSPSEILALRAGIGVRPGCRVLVAGSIHPGEERPLLAAFTQARKDRINLLLVLAPRHPDKFAELEKEFAGTPFVVRRRTQLTSGETWDVLILDTIGELDRFYALSDAAFIGGSLVPWGGQNLLEPAFYGKPVFFGPHMTNFADLADRFVAGGGAVVVEKPEELTAMFRFGDEERLAEQGRMAKTILISLQGATEKTVAAIESLMPRAKA
jgi:3-deoxy-D-manno-octulosonic-acid transferase